MFCKNCGQQIDDNAAVCPNCGAPQQLVKDPFQSPPADQGGILWGLLGCCIPIVGLILFLVWKDQKPSTAKAAGIGAIVGVVLGVVWYIILFALGLLSTAAMY